MYPTLRLEAPGLDTLVLDPYDGWIGTAFDPGDAETRAVTDPAPDADGTIDSTSFTGARAVTLRVDLVATSLSLWEMRQRLRAFTSPAIRPTLYVQFAPDAPEQRMVLRRSQFNDV